MPRYQGPFLSTFLVCLFQRPAAQWRRLEPKKHFRPYIAFQPPRIPLTIRNTWLHRVWADRFCKRHTNIGQELRNLVSCNRQPSLKCFSLLHEYSPAGTTEPDGSENRVYIECTFGRTSPGTLGGIALMVEEMRVILATHLNFGTSPGQQKDQPRSQWFAIR